MKKKAAKRIDLIILSAIFCIILLYIYDYISSIVWSRPYFMKWSVDHFHCIKDCVLEIILCALLFWKTYRLGACVFTKVAIWSYAFLILTSLFYYLFLFPYKILLIIGSILLFGGMGLMFLLFIIRICFKKLGK
jgi:hypothetical protein